MKFKIIYFSILVLFITMIMQSASQGVGNRFNQDRTGGPVSLSTCSACHSGGSFNGVLSAVVTDMGGNTVTSYMAGQAYTVTFTVSSNGNGSSAAFQGVALNGSNGSTGTWSNPQTGVRISSVNSRQYVEHSSPKTGGGNITFVATWTAPASGTGNVTFYAAGIVANGNGGTSGDQPTSGISLVLSEQVVTTLSYPNTNYCLTDNDPSPTVVGQTGGTFAAAPTGLSINTNTGVIDLSTSTIGSYTVTYTYSGGTTTAPVTINGTDNAGFIYSRNSYCFNAVDPTPTLLGNPMTRGTFTALPAGLAITDSTGTIDLSASIIGTYTVTHISSGICPDTSTAIVSVSALDNAGFSYASNSYCSNENDPTPVITGFFGGNFSAIPAGLGLNTSTGEIDLSTSTAGTYTVTYNTNGACPNDSSVTITINTTLDDANFNYTNVNYCANDTATYLPNLLGTTGGLFSVQPIGLMVDASTGALTAGMATAGNYMVTYSTSGACPDTTTVPVVINAADSATISYSSMMYCTNDTDPTPTITGQAGGKFVGILRNPNTTLALDSLTGSIDLNLSTAGIYDIVYSTSGACPTTDTATVMINQSDMAVFAYTDTSFCANGVSNPTLAASSNQSGVYTSSSVDLVVLDSTTGEIDLLNSNPGRYTLTFTTNGVCPATTTTIVELFLCGGVSSMAMVNDFQLFPNPNNGQFQIRNNGLGEEVMVVVRDLYGKTVYNQATYMANGTSATIDATSLITGLYTVEVVGERGLQTFKMILE